MRRLLWLRRHGVVRLPEFLPTSLVDDILRRLPEGAAGAAGVESRERSGHKTCLNQLLQDFSILERVRAITKAADLQCVSAELQTRSPRSDPEPWRDGWGCTSRAVHEPARPELISLVIYLDGATAATGALQIQRAPYVRRRGASEAPAPSAGTGGAAAVRTLECRRGDAILLEARVLRAAKPNSGATPRRRLQLDFILDWARCAPEFRQRLYRTPDAA